MVKYDSYKDSGVEWIGEIPIHWDISKIKYENNVISSNIDKKEYEGFNKYNIIHYNDVVKYQQIFKNNISDFGYCSESQYESFKVKKHDIILTKDSMDISNICDSSIVLDEPVKCVFGYHLTKLTTESDLILPFFEFLFINNPKIKEYFLISSNGTTIIGVSKATIENTSILIPSLPEQHQIVEFLNEKTSIIDDLIQKKLRKIELLKEQRTSLINHTVTKGLNPYVKMKDSGVEWIGEIPRIWNESQFKNYIKLRHGHQFRDNDFTDFGIKIIKITQLHKDGYLDISNCSTIDEERLNNFQDILINEGDILMCLTGGTIGKIIRVGKVNEPLLQNYRVGHFSPLDEHKMYNNYMFYLMSSEVIIGQIFYDVRETGQPNIGMEDMNRMRICIPPPNEQQQIVEYLDEQTSIIDTTISKEQKRIELLKEYPQSLISNVVTGKIKVTTDE